MKIMAQKCRWSFIESRYAYKLPKKKMLIRVSWEKSSKVSSCAFNPYGFFFYINTMRARLWCSRFGFTSCLCKFLSLLQHNGRDIWWSIYLMLYLCFWLRGFMWLIGSTPSTSTAEPFHTCSLVPRHLSRNFYAPWATPNLQSKAKRCGLKNQEDRDEDHAISKIPVSRQKYIPVSKSELLDGVVSNLFWDENDVDDLQQFLLSSGKVCIIEINERATKESNLKLFIWFCWCLDLILHAEHKTFLE